MVAQIGLEADVADISLSPGETAVVQLTLSNLGQVVDAFDLLIRNLDPGWYTFKPAEVSLFPGDKAPITLLLHPPASASMRSGQFSFDVEAISRDNPDASTSLSIGFQLAAISDVSVDLVPQKIVAHHGTYTLLLKNPGNVSRPVVLHPSDTDEFLLFSFGQAQVSSISDAPIGKKTDNAPDPATQPSTTTTDPAAAPSPPSPDVGDVAVGRPVGDGGSLPPSLDMAWTLPGKDSGQGYLELTLPPAYKVELPLLIRTKKRIWFGKREIPFRFQVAATPPGVEWEPGEARYTSGELVYKPYLAALAFLPPALRWALLGALILIPLVALALLLPNAVGGAPTSTTPTPDAGANATQTALAQANANATQTAQANANATRTAEAQAQANANATQTALAQANANVDADATGTAQAITNATGTAVAIPPEIVSFAWAPQPDGSWSAVWEVVGADSVKINDKDVEAKGSQPQSADPVEDLHLVATNQYGTVNRDLGKLTPSPPKINTFTSDAAGNICRGCQVILTWDIAGAAQAWLDGTPIPDDALNNGTALRNPLETTEYWLLAINDAGQVESIVRVGVVPSPTPKPKP